MKLQWLLLVLITGPVFSLNIIDYYQGLVDRPGYNVTADAIPAKHDGNIVRFNIKSANVEHVLPRNQFAMFNPYLDAGDFKNFSSISVVNDEIVEKRDVNGGTCFGCSYFTSMWYQRLIRPSLMGLTPDVVKHLPMSWVPTIEESFSNGEQMRDGINFIAYKVFTSQSIPYRNDFFTDEQMMNHTRSYRLYNISRGPLATEVKLGAIAHHNDQSLLDRVKLQATDPQKLHQWVTQIKSRIEEHGTQVFWFRKYDLEESWNTWTKFRWGHALVFYRVSNVDVQSSLGDSRQAVKLHFYDPNFLYHNTDAFDTGEGWGTYLIYFPDSGQISFSKMMQDRYNIQKTVSSTIDDAQIKMGFYDVYEGHPVQDEIAVENFLMKKMGKGRQITRAERILLESSDAERFQIVKVKTGVVTAWTLNFRDAPDGEVIGQFHKNDSVEILGNEGEWYKVKSDTNVEGYVHSDWIDDAPSQEVFREID